MYCMFKCPFCSLATLFWITCLGILFSFSAVHFCEGPCQVRFVFMFWVDASCPFNQAFYFGVYMFLLLENWIANTYAVSPIIC